MKSTTLSALLLIATMYYSHVTLAQRTERPTLSNEEKTFLAGRLQLSKLPDERPQGYQISGNPSFDRHGYGRAYIHHQVDSINIDLAILSPMALRPNAHFGYSTDLVDSVAIVGAPGGGLMHTGEAYFFTKMGNSWRLMDKITPEESQPRDDFGYTVALLGPLAFVAAPSADGARRNLGAIYVYHQAGNGHWNYFHKLQPERMKSVMYFGKYIETYDNLIIVGAEHRKDRRDVAFAYQKIEGVWEESYYFESVPALERFMKKWKEQHPEPKGKDMVSPSDLLQVDTEAIIGSTENDFEENER
ncbi:MAG: FG-GAP repeat protein [Bacteroidota bacterium]